MEFIATPCKCDLCKRMFNADYTAITYSPFDDGYAGNDICINLRKKYKTKRILKRMCPDCTEKLLEILDKHFPRLNLEDEV